MRDGVTLQRRLSLAGRKPKISPAILCQIPKFTHILNAITYSQYDEKERETQSQLIQ